MSQAPREIIVSHIQKTYGARPESLWIRFPGYLVFRHEDNQKWFAAIMDVPREKLGLPGEGRLDVLTVKVPDPLLRDLLLSQPGFLRAYHFGGDSWLSLCLDRPVDTQRVFPLIDGSFRATASAATRNAMRPARDWLVPANPKYYDIVHAFDSTDEILWKQGTGIRTGDTVYLYVAAPISAVLYRCCVTDTEIPCDHRGQIRIKALMRIRLTERYDPAEFPFERLKREYGVFAVRGPRGIPELLREDLEKHHRREEP